MKIEHDITGHDDANQCLNPYSNGMKIEHGCALDDVFLCVLILILME